MDRVKHKVADERVPLHQERPAPTFPHMETNDIDYEKFDKLMGDWVTARCRKRTVEHGKPMDKNVWEWLKGLEWNPSAKDAEAPAEVLGWVVKTIEDPDWPRAQ